MHAINQQQRITTKKTTNLTPFEEHFGRKFKTATSNNIKKKQIVSTLAVIEDSKLFRRRYDTRTIVPCRQRVCRHRHVQQF